MKNYFFIALFLLLSPAGQAQSVLNKKVSFNVDELPLRKAIIQLSLQSNIGFTFNGNILPNHTVSLHIEEKSLSFVLDQLLKNTLVSYREKGNQVVLSRVRRQEFYTISGYVKDAETGERLIAANVFEKMTGKGIATNEYGFYSIRLPGKNMELIFSFLGYKSRLKKISLKRNIRLNIELKPSLMLEEVIVTSKGGTPGVVGFTENTESVPLKHMKYMPTPGGEEDVLRAVNLLPGVQTGPDGFGGLSIRGGSSDQNLILLDGVPVYNPVHMGGLFSIFNSSAVKSARLYKGDFPARYGGRLSSVLDIRTKEGNQRNFSGEVSLGLIALKAALEGPIIQNKSSFFFSFRKSIVDAFLKPVSRKLKEKKGDTGITRHTFSDFNGKVNLFLGNKDQLFLSIYHGGDQFRDQNKSMRDGVNFIQVDHNQDLNWGNTIGSLRWNHLFNDRLFANTTLTFSKFWFDSEELYEENITALNQGESSFDQDKLLYSLYHSEIEDISAKIDFDFIPFTNHYVRFGAGVINHTFRPGAFTLDHNSAPGFDDRFSVDSLVAINNTVKSQEYSLYLEDNLVFTPKLKGNLGFRSTYVNVQATRYFTFQPRLSFTYQWNSKNQLKFSINKMMQNLHLLTNTGLGLPTDLWVPATSKVRPQEAWQAGFAWNKSFEGGFELSAELYGKSMKNLITYEEGSSFLIESFVLDASNWENKVTRGRGKSYGLEIFVRKVTGQLKGWLNYTLARSNRRFEGINLGETYRYRFDRPHSIKVAGIYQLNNRINFSANWTYESGMPTTLPLDEYTYYSSNLFSPVSVQNVGAKNSFRLPDNHHLDMGVNFIWGKQKRQQIFKIGVYNIYNRKNPFYYRIREQPGSNGQKEFVQVSLFPFTPSFSYTARF